MEDVFELFDISGLEDGADVNGLRRIIGIDEGYRYSPEQNRNLTKIERFREILKRDHIINGNLVIDFNTSILQGFKGGFF